MRLLRQLHTAQTHSIYQWTPACSMTVESAGFRPIRRGRWWDIAYKPPYPCRYHANTAMSSVSLFLQSYRTHDFYSATTRRAWKETCHVSYRNNNSKKLLAIITRHVAALDIPWNRFNGRVQHPFSLPVNYSSGSGRNIGHTRQLMNLAGNHA